MTKLALVFCLLVSSSVSAQVGLTRRQEQFLEFLGWFSNPICKFIAECDLQYSLMDVAAKEAKNFVERGESAFLAEFLECYREDNIARNISHNSRGREALVTATRKELAELLVVSNLRIKQYRAGKKDSIHLEQVNGFGVHVMDDGMARRCLSQK